MRHGGTPRAGRLAVVLLVALALFQGGAGVAAAEVVEDDAWRVARRLVTWPERAHGYDRARFRHWVDDDGDGCDARREVLIAEAVVRPRVRARCRLEGGRWHSAYDGLLFRDPARLDVDHVVALREAWRSGAHRWDDGRRRAFANDLGDPRSLRAVSAASNRSKGDRDPADWLPPLETFRCRYVAEWLAVKARWRLAMDPAERAAVRDVLRGCPGMRIRVERAP
jgi:hypothetical protein